jgi:hypothetical protein
MVEVEMIATSAPYEPSPAETLPDGSVRPL